MILRAFLLCLTTGLAAQAQGTITAAGRLEIVGRGGTCSAALIEPDVIATAAHCITGTDQVFRPGDGLAGAIFLVEGFVKHPLYEQTSARIDWKLRFDIAVGRLAKPVPPDRAVPLSIGEEARPGETLFLVSWRRDGTREPRQRACVVLEGIEGLVTLDCPVEGGESGSPVLRKTADGFELVAIVSSKGRWVDRPVAQASDVRLRLSPIVEELNETTP